jgi:hypothetical protein
MEEEDSSLYFLPDVAEPPKLLGPHAPALVSKTSDGYACAPDNITGFVDADFATNPFYPVLIMALLDHTC